MPGRGHIIAISLIGLTASCLYALRKSGEDRADEVSDWQDDFPARGIPFASAVDCPGDVVGPPTTAGAIVIIPGDQWATAIPVRSSFHSLEITDGE